MQKQYNKKYFEEHMKGGYEKQKDNPTFQKRINEFKELGYKRGIVLDVGCAYGYFMKKCEEFGYQTVGVDVSDFALKQAKKVTDGNLIVADISEKHLPLESESIDIISMFNTLEHLNNYSSAIKECLRLLKTGGLLYIYVPTENRWLTDKTHINFFTVRTLRFVLENNGFEILKLGEEGGMLRNAFGLMRMIFRGNTNFNFVPTNSGSFISCFAKKKLTHI